jgi:hypothetical protein
MASSLHQCLNYIVNGTLVTIKAKEILAMVQNMIVPYIESKGNKDGSLHAFEIVNT